MWEALHLFSRYNKGNYVQATSQNETLVSAYPTVNETSDSMTVVLVNRSLTLNQKINLNFAGYTINDGTYSMYSLSKLGTAETFVSHTKNALVKSDVTAGSNLIAVDLAPLSVNTIILKGMVTAVKPGLKMNDFKASIYPNPASDQVHLKFSLPERSQVKIDLFKANGQLIKSIGNIVYESGAQSTEISLKGLSSGIYWIKLTSESNSQSFKLIIYQ